jgi:DNA-binding NarL/FixJ family response regulator
MPGQEGIETMRWVHQTYPNLPVLAISGAVPAEILNASSKLGATETLSKPFAPETLLEVVRDLIGTA